MTRDMLTALADRSLELGPDRTPDYALEHWRLTRAEDGIAWLLVDRANASANTLSEAVMRELDEVLTHLEADPPRGLAIRSAKPSGFIAGADIRDFKDTDDEAAVAELMQRANLVTDRLAALDYPTVAVIHGYCLGGGLEIALACDYRIAVDGARFGFPEVMLGLHPGMGGTVRLTRLIDPLEAMTMMLRGSTAHTERAKKLGIVDAVTQERHVNNAVAAAVAGKIAPAEHGLFDAALTTTPGRVIAARQMESRVTARAPKAHYPAPHALIDLWKTHGGDADAMRQAEIASFAKLMCSDTARNLIRVYLLRNMLKSLAGQGGERIDHVHVIGAGAMGGDIASWCAIKGCTVSLSDVSLVQIAAVVKRATRLCANRHLSSIERRDVLDRLIPDPNGTGVGRADLVMETAPERLDVKLAIYADVEPRMKAGAMLASNTSSIPLEHLAGGLQDPTRFVGVHFFNPVARMDVVEIVSHTSTATGTLARARAFAGQIDKLPAPVSSAPGFLVNRALMPYLMEALVMIDEGTAKETVDLAAEAFGMPVGPVELADRVGLDICVDVAQTLQASLDSPMAEIPGWLRERVDAGELGRKTRRGLYPWKGGDPQKARHAAAPTSAMSDRLLLPLLNACAACLRTGVVDDADVLDGAIVFGTGFAPFRGGPMHYARARGVAEIIATLERLARQHGPRFEPDPHWHSLT